MRIFLTGGTGFIGQYVLSKLQNEELLILNHNPKKRLPRLKKAQLIQGDLANIGQWQSRLKDFNPETAIHMAWEGIPDYGTEMSKKNLNHSLRLYKLLTQTDCETILTTGSCWEYGGQQGKLSENTSYKPFNEFTAAKNSLYIRGNEICQKNNVNFIWTRLFYVYGPGQRKESLIPYLINCAKSNIIPEIKNPDAQNDFIYVEDVAEAIYQIIKKSKKSNIYNIGSGKLTSIQIIIKIIFKRFGKDYKFQKGLSRQTDSLSSFYADISKIKKGTGWMPDTNIEEGLRKTILYFTSPH